MSHRNTATKTDNHFHITGCAHYCRRQRRRMSAGWINRYYRKHNMDAHHLGTTIRLVDTHLHHPGRRTTSMSLLSRRPHRPALPHSSCLQRVTNETTDLISNLLSTAVDNHTLTKKTHVRSFVFNNYMKTRIINFTHINNDTVVQITCLVQSPSNRSTTLWGHSGITPLLTQRKPLLFGGPKDFVLQTSTHPPLQLAPIVRLPACPRRVQPPSPLYPAGHSARLHRCSRSSGRAIPTDLNPPYAPTRPGLPQARLGSRPSDFLQKPPIFSHVQKGEKRRSHLRRQPDPNESWFSYPSNNATTRPTGLTACSQLPPALQGPH